MKLARRSWIAGGAGALAVVFAATALAAGGGSSSGTATAVAADDIPEGGACFAELKTVDGAAPAGSELFGFVGAEYTDPATQEQARDAIASVAKGEVECGSFDELEAEMPEFDEELLEKGEVPEGGVEVFPEGDELDEDELPENAEIIDGIEEPVGVFLAEVDPSALGITAPEGVEIEAGVEAIYDGSANADDVKAAVANAAGVDPSEVESEDFEGMEGFIEECDGDLHEFDEDDESEDEGDLDEPEDGKGEDTEPEDEEEDA